jgi:hypothetical protein
MHPEAGCCIDLADGATVFLIGDGDVRREEVDPPHIQPDGLDGPHRHLDIVRVHDVGHVDRGPAGRQIAGRTEIHHLALWRDGVPVVALLGEKPLGLMIELEAGEHLLVAHAAARVAVDDLDQVFDRVLAVPHDVTRYPLGDSDQLPVHHQHPVIVSPDEALDDHAAAVLLSHREGGANLRGIGQVDRDASSRGWRCTASPRPG